MHLVFQAFGILPYPRPASLPWASSWPGRNCAWMSVPSWRKRKLSNLRLPCHLGACPHDGGKRGVLQCGDGQMATRIMRLDSRGRGDIVLEDLTIRNGRGQSGRK